MFFSHVSPFKINCMKNPLLLIKRVSLAVAVLFLASACCNSSNVDEKKGVVNPPKHLIIVGFDGMSANSIKNGVDMPTYRKMMEQGSSSVSVRSILPSSSACNWASMFMGAPSELHGYNTWGSQTPDFPSRVLTPNGTFPDIFYQIRSAHPDKKLAHFYEWEGMRYVVDTLSIDMVMQMEPSVENVDKALEPVLSYITSEKPYLSTIIFDQPDGAGHSKGWESQEYYRMLTYLDNALAKIVKAVLDAGMLEETLFVLVSDHGGVGTGHGGPTLDEMEIPLTLYGKGVKKGYEIQESVMIYDIAATVNYILSGEQPQVWTGRPIMSIFED